MAKKIQPMKAFEDILAAAAKIPGVHIDRDSFLRSALKKYCDDATIEKAVAESPAAAQIPLTTIERLANDSINYETAKVTALSAAAGIPGGFAMIGTVPADTAQYIAHVLRVAQKLAYLYSWPSLFDKNGQMDDATKSLLTLFIGVMFGAQAAVDAVGKVAEVVSATVVRELPRKALTHGVIYPIVKKVAEYLGVQMTRETFAQGVSKIIPVVGGVLSGGITLATFRPMCAKLRNYLAELPLANPEMHKEGAGSVTARDKAVSTIEAEVLDVTDVRRLPRVNVSGRLRG